MPSFLSVKDKKVNFNQLFISPFSGERYRTSTLFTTFCQIAPIVYSGS